MLGAATETYHRMTIREDSRLLHVLTHHSQREIKGEATAGRDRAGGQSLLTHKPESTDVVRPGLERQSHGRRGQTGLLGCGPHHHGPKRTLEFRRHSHNSESV